ncbi:uncharacterized protein MONOS_1210 [Monocercomonoides exilis]|uniref:uncharacterized protein n=1 Tax=Monocercomonoides exilis TaxID=2049356 RepID=UPI00355A89D7|nr:hypothetical protein MONOS_1210 [Monocercomonoides exilis]|eukprot:MONOS_1210.1-p1 / transcript=MONOS_1210.1 / gene=MONOS_1210 / organism=Monocercomonoides_exilis_PA203 / gene_product=unspecified product / transcript_product=unspecified product / location=Mono_scaffold00020:187784-188008(-) / protein_length=75 / sequence_SO=supercontig / SO=protein_coding / is_pseudo=false
MYRAYTPAASGTIDRSRHSMSSIAASDVYDAATAEAFEWKIAGADDECDNFQSPVESSFHFTASGIAKKTITLL